MSSIDAGKALVPKISDRNDSWRIEYRSAESEVFARLVARSPPTLLVGEYRSSRATMTGTSLRTLVRSCLQYRCNDASSEQRSNKVWHNSTCRDASSFLYRPFSRASARTSRDAAAVLGVR